MREKTVRGKKVKRQSESDTRTTLLVSPTHTSTHAHTQRAARALLSELQSTLVANLCTTRADATLIFSSSDVHSFEIKGAGAHSARRLSSSFGVRTTVDSSLLKIFSITPWKKAHLTSEICEI